MDTLKQLSALALELQRGARREPAQAFVDWALETLKAQVPFDSAIWATGFAEPGQMPVVQSAHLHRQPPQMLVDYQQVVGSDTLLAAAVQAPGVAIVADTPSWAPPQVLDYLRRYGIAHSVATCTVNPRTALVTGISLWRADPGRPYAEPERQLVEAVFPHLIEARAQNHLFHLVNAANPRFSGPWRPAATDANGLLHHADEEFTQLLATEWPDWHGPHLPAPLRQALRTRGQSRMATQHLVFKVEPMAELVLVQARPISVLDRLTAREREVAAYTAQGLTHKEIARLLEVSPATVRTHLSTSCRRVGAKNKAHLAAWVTELG